MKRENSNYVNSNEYNSYESKPFVSDYSVYEAARPTSIYDELISKPKYVLPHVRRLVPSRNKISKTSVIMPLCVDSRSRQFKPLQLNENKYSYNHEKSLESQHSSLSRITIKNMSNKHRRNRDCTFTQEIESKQGCLKSHNSHSEATFYGEKPSIPIRNHKLILSKAAHIASKFKRASTNSKAKKYKQYCTKGGRKISEYSRPNLKLTRNRNNRELP